MKVEVRKVEGNSGMMRDFVRLPRMLYRDVPQYVPDLDSDITDLFNRKRNPGLEFSDVQPFLAYRDNVPVGRIVGIVNRKANERWQQRVVRFGLIEFIDDLDVSRALLEAVGQWGRKYGMDTLQGPMGITDFDKEGMLVEDFHLTGTITSIWNPDYYPRHMEALGFQKEVDWVQIRIQIPQETPLRYSRTAQYVREQIGLRVVKLSRSEISRGGYGQRMFQLLNQAYEPIFGFSSLTAQQNLSKATTGMNTAMERLTTGYKINSGKDDAAGSAVSTLMEAQISGYDVAEANAQMGLSLLDTAEGVLGIVGEYLQRIRDLTEQAANGTYGTSSMTAIKTEVQQRIPDGDSPVFRWRWAPRSRSGAR